MMFSRCKLLILAIALVTSGAISSSFAQQGWVATRIAPAGQDLNTVFFRDDKRGWVGGDNGFLSRTDDGGRTWVQQAVGTSDPVNDVYFRDKEEGFLLAGNAIFVTRDRGTRWSEVRRFRPAEFDGAIIELYSVRFASKKKGWVVGSVSQRDRVMDSILAYTDDGGRSWRRQQTPSRLELIHIDFVSDKRGWIVGAGGTILKTQDGGKSWISQISGTDATLYHVNFRNNKKGWAVGERGTILRTTDGGDGWTPIKIDTRATLLSVHFVNDNNGWLVGRGGTIFRTSDGGLSWIQQASTVKDNFYSLYFNKNTGWAVGSDGVILRYER
jgi:photosystem II stability/assembly factor-like uncharacterized protein